MKGYILLTLLFVTVLGEKKLNLEDIERDNLHMETKSDDVSDSKYNIKEEDQYQGSTNVYETQNSQGTTYADLQPVTGSKYSPEDYSQASKYSQNDAAYQQQTITSGSQQANQPTQYYREVVPENIPQATHESQQIVYQPEVIVGNQIQTFQQKSAAEKFIKNLNKDSFYVNIPTTQLLSYYPNLGVSKVSSKTQTQPLYHRLAAQMNQHSSVPAYLNDLNQNQFYASGKFAYQIQPQYLTYAPKNPSHTQAVISKGSKAKIYAVSPDAKTYTEPQFFSMPIYTKTEQPRKVLYFSQPQAQYFPQIVYAEPKAVYSQTSPVYTDLYARSPAFLQDNSLNSYSNQYSQNQQYYIPTTIDEQLVKLIQKARIRGATQEREKIPEEPTEHFVPPQLPAQKFKSGVTQLLPISTGSESLPAKSFTLSSEPKSLLDTYIPSYLIAAQDTARYTERPIKLEGGFLPSKINFIHSYKKRKSE